jgi:hypothetical protein
MLLVLLVLLLLVLLQGYCCQSGYSCTRDNSWW